MGINYDSPGEIAGFLKERGLWLKKRFGQNFLVNPGARRRLIELLRLTGDESVWEIGPGIGSITAGLLEQCRDLKVFEIDRGLVRVLTELFPGLCIIEGDVIDTWPGVYASAGVPGRVFGNLPYSSSAAIILSFLERDFLPQRMVFTLQKEQAERMAASPGSGSYSSFSVLCSACFRIEQAGDLKPGSFFPRPEVMSRIVVLTPNNGFAIERKDLFMKLTRDLFAKKRKTLRNNLASGSLAAEWGQDVLFETFEECSVPLSGRAEELPAALIAGCADTLGKILLKKGSR